MQVARRCYQVLLVHMTRFTYSPTGALKWKKDVSEYAEVLSTYDVPAANDDMDYLQQVCIASSDPEGTGEACVCAECVWHCCTRLCVSSALVLTACFAAVAASLQLLNVLVVAPESLVGLVNGSLRMAHR